MTTVATLERLKALLKSSVTLEQIERWHLTRLIDDALYHRPAATMQAGDIGCREVECQRGKGDPPADCIWPDCHCGVYYAPEFWDMYYLQWLLGQEPSS